MTLRIVARGTWLYGGTVETPVDVIALDYDWSFEFDRAEGRLQPGQVPERFGANGVFYYARFKHALSLAEPTWPDTAGYRTVEGAMREAEGKVEGGIRWSAEPA